MKADSKLHVVKPAAPKPAPKKRTKKAEIRVGLMDPSFKYVHSTQTNIAATFARIKAELAAKGKKK
jgi:hypothetical protein